MVRRNVLKCSATSPRVDYDSPKKYTCIHQCDRLPVNVDRRVINGRLAIRLNLYTNEGDLSVISGGCCSSAVMN